MSECHYTPMTEFQREQYRHTVWRHIGCDPIGLIDRAVARGWAKRPVMLRVETDSNDGSKGKPKPAAPRRKWLGVRSQASPPTPLPAALTNVDPGANLNVNESAVDYAWSNSERTTQFDGRK